MFVVLFNGVVLGWGCGLGLMRFYWVVISVMLDLC